MYSFKTSLTAEGQYQMKLEMRTTTSQEFVRTETLIPKPIDRTADYEKAKAIVRSGGSLFLAEQEMALARRRTQG